MRLCGRSNVHPGSPESAGIDAGVHARHGHRELGPARARRRVSPRARMPAIPTLYQFGHFGRTTIRCRFQGIAQNCTVSSTPSSCLWRCCHSIRRLPDRFGPVANALARRGEPIGTFDTFDSRTCVVAQPDPGYEQHENTFSESPDSRWRTGSRHQGTREQGAAPNRREWYRERRAAKRGREARL